MDGILEVIKARFDECIDKINAMEGRIHDQDNFKVLVESLAARVESLRQQVAEYRQWKDPKDHEGKLDRFVKLADKNNTLVGEMMIKLQQFEQKEWMRMLSDDELIEQVKLSGKTLKDISEKFQVTVENAHNYRTAVIKDHNLRWKLYRFCGGA